MNTVMSRLPVPISLFFSVNSTSFRKVPVSLRVTFRELVFVFHNALGKNNEAISKIAQAIDIKELLGSKTENRFVII